MLTDLEILDRCILLYSRPGRWTQKTLARDAKGKTVPVFSEEARAFDLEGAIRRSAGKDDRTAYARFADKSGPMKSHISPHRNLFDWNDAQGRTQKDVVLMLQDFADEYRFRDI